MNPRSPGIIRLLEIIGSKPIPKSYKNEILKSIEDLLVKTSVDEINKSWEFFVNIQKGTGILQDIQKDLKHWREISDFLGIDIITASEDSLPKRKQTLPEYFLQLRSAYKNIEGFTVEEKIHLEVSFTYIALELSQVAYMRDSKVMKLAWDRACEIMDRRGMDYKGLLRDVSEVSLNLIF